MEENGDTSVIVNKFIAGEHFANDVRVIALSAFFDKQFEQKPDFFVRVPGRVNIIGEHVDYCGYPVLPMALNQCMLLAVGIDSESSSSMLELRNLDAEKFDNYTCDLATVIVDLPPTPAGISPKWYKYYLCGIKGIYDALNEDDDGTGPFGPIGMRIAVSGNIPPASGLSSSSALVSAAVLATAHVHKLQLERRRLAAISANCERYIGTQGGGMDQAIAYLAKPGCAQYIEFHPQLKATTVQLPQGTCFVVVNSLAEINKAATSDFNERVVECRLSCLLIAKQSGCVDYQRITKFALLQDALECTLEQLEKLVVTHVPKDIYTLDEICHELNITDDKLRNEFLTPNTFHMTKFKLRQRALHVVRESLRVQEFRRICEQSNANNSDLVQNVQNLSQLMRSSHHSLTELYECSHPDLDRIVAISDELNVGSRLTGAGWGGCAVALCESLEASQQYIAAVKAKYFAHLPLHKLIEHQRNDFADVIFATTPCGGAEIFQC